MNEIHGERDINDVFDDILLTEEIVTKTSYTEGFTDGSVAGNSEGYHLGYHRGSEIGAELGYYMGIILVNRSEITHSEKITNILCGLSEAIVNFPRTNDENIDIFQLIDKIRSQFKRLCTFLKISSKYPEGSSLNF